MAFLVSTYNSCSIFHITDFSQGLWGSRCSHMQIIATPRQDPGSGGSEPVQFHLSRLEYPSPSSNGLHHFCQGFNLIEISSLHLYFINISQPDIIRPYLYIYLLESDPRKAGIVSGVISRLSLGKQKRKDGPFLVHTMCRRQWETDNRGGPRKSVLSLKSSKIKDTFSEK